MNRRISWYLAFVFSSCHRHVRLLGFSVWLALRISVDRAGGSLED
jgi:hypothetical protein